MKDISNITIVVSNATSEAESFLLRLVSTTAALGELGSAAREAPAFCWNKYHCEMQFYFIHNIQHNTFTCFKRSSFICSNWDSKSQCSLSCSKVAILSVLSCNYKELNDEACKYLKNQNLYKRWWTYSNLNRVCFIQISWDGITHNRIPMSPP